MPVTVASRAAMSVVGPVREDSSVKIGIEEFEIADGDGVEDQGVVLFVVADAIEVAEGVDAGGGVECGRCGSGRRTE